jgi:P-type Cu+ transporter
MPETVIFNELHAVTSQTGSKRCAHCGDVCGSETITTSEKVFCCAGCRSVYAILQQHDLCEYYDREDVGVRMREFRSTSDQYAILDNEAVELKLLSFSSATLHRITWTIPTLHCASCVWLLEQLNRLNSGVMSSTVDMMRKSTTVDYDPRETSLREIAETLASIGYSPLIQLEGEVIGGSGTRALYARLGLAAFATVNTMLLAIAQYLAGPQRIDPSLLATFRILTLVLSVPVLVYSASPWLTAAYKSLKKRHVSLDIPVAAGILALFVRSVIDIANGTGEGYLDSFTALVFLLLIGRLFQQKAFDALSFDRSYRSFFPLSVRALRDDVTVVIPVDQVALDDVLVIRNGEVIPCDCRVASEVGYIDYSFVTGESRPVEVLKDQRIHAGGRVVGRAVTLVAEKEVEHSELAKMWDRSWKRASRTTFLNISDRFGLWFTVTAFVLAFGGAIMWWPDTSMAVNVFSAVLIIACPCALTLSAPITLGTAMGKLGRLGIFLKNVGTLLELERISSVLLDKTGTLTKSENRIEYTGRELTSAELCAVRSVAAHSAHPISRAIAQGKTGHNVVDPLEFVGAGISGRCENIQVRLGSARFMTERIELSTDLIDAKATYLALNDEYIGRFNIKPTLRIGVPHMIRELLASGLNVHVISGDSDSDKRLLQPFLGADNLVFNCRPEDKIEQVEREQNRGERVLMVGDGLNDAGAMGAADVAIAVTDDTATLVPACDVIIRSQALSTLPVLLQYAKSAKRVIVLCFVLSIIFNAVGLTLAIVGSLTPLAAAIFMPVSSLTVIGASVLGAKLGANKVETKLRQQEEVEG